MENKKLIYSQNLRSNVLKKQNSSTSKLHRELNDSYGANRVGQKINNDKYERMNKSNDYHKYDSSAINNNINKLKQEYSRNEEISNVKVLIDKFRESSPNKNQGSVNMIEDIKKRIDEMKLHDSKNKIYDKNLDNNIDKLIKNLKCELSDISKGIKNSEEKMEVLFKNSAYTKTPEGRNTIKGKTGDFVIKEKSKEDDKNFNLLINELKRKNEDLLQEMSVLKENFNEKGSPLRETKKMSSTFQENLKNRFQLEKQINPHEDKFNEHNVNRIDSKTPHLNNNLIDKLRENEKEISDKNQQIKDLTINLKNYEKNSFLNDNKLQSMQNLVNELINKNKRESTKYEKTILQLKNQLEKFQTNDLSNSTIEKLYVENEQNAWVLISQTFDEDKIEKIWKKLDNISNINDIDFSGIKNLFDVENKLEELSYEYQKMEDEFNEARKVIMKGISEKENYINDVNGEFEKYELTLQKYQEELNLTKSNEKNLTKELNETKLKLKSFQDLTQSIKNFEDDNRKLSFENQKLKLTIENMKKPEEINKIGNETDENLDKLKEELKNLQNKYQQLIKTTNSKELIYSAMMEKTESLKQEKSSGIEKINALLNENQSLRNEITSLSKKIEGFSSIEGEMLRLRNDYEKCVEDFGSSLKLKDEQEKILEDLKLVNLENERIISELKSEIEIKSESINSLLIKNNEITENEYKIKVNSENLEKKLNEYSKLIEEFNKEMISKDKQINEINSLNENLNSKLILVQNDLTENLNENKRLNGKNLELLAIQNDLESKLKINQIEINNQKKIKEEVESFRIEVSNLKEYISKLELQQENFEKIQEEYNEKLKEKNFLDKNLNDKTKTLLDLKSSLEGREIEILKSEKKINGLETENNLLKESIKKLEIQQENYSDLIERCESLSKYNLSIQNESELKSKEIEILKEKSSKLEEFEKEIVQKNLKIEEMIHSQDELQKILNETNIKLDKNKIESQNSIDVLNSKIKEILEANMKIASDSEKTCKLLEESKKTQKKLDEENLSLKEKSKEKIKHLKEQLSTKETELKCMELNLENLKKIIDEKEKSFLILTSNITSEKELEIVNLNNKLNELRENNDSLIAKNDLCLKVIEEQEKTIKILNDNINESGNQINNLIQNESKLSNKIKELSNILQSKENIISDLTQNQMRYQEIEAQLENEISKSLKLQNTLGHIQQVNNELNRKNQGYENNIESLNEILQNKMNEIYEINFSFSKFKEENLQKIQELNDLNTKNSKENDKLINSKDKEIKKLQLLIKEQKDLMDETHTSIEFLKNSLEKEKSISTNYENVINSRDQQIQNFKNQILSYESNIKDQNEGKSELIKNLNNQNQQLLEEKENLSQININLSNNLKNCKIENENFSNIVASLKKEIDEKNGEINEILLKIQINDEAKENYEKKLKLQENLIIQREEQLSNNDKRIKSLEKSLNDFKDKHKNISFELNEKNKIIDELLTKIQNEVQINSEQKSKLKEFEGIIKEKNLKYLEIEENKKAIENTIREEIRIQYEEELKENKKLIESLENENSSLSQLTAESKLKYDTTIQAYNKNIIDLNNQINLKVNEIENLNKKTFDLETVNTNIKLNQQALENTISDLKLNIEKIKSEYSQKILKKEDDLFIFKKIIAEQEEVIEKLKEKEKFPSKSDTENVCEKLKNDFDSEKAEFLSKIENLSKINEKLVKENYEMKLDFDKFNKKAEELVSQVNNYKNGLSQTLEKLSECEDKLVNSNEENKTLKSIQEDLLNNIEKYEEKIEIFKKTEKDTQIKINNILKEKETVVNENEKLLKDFQINESSINELNSKYQLLSKQNKENLNKIISIGEENRLLKNQIEEMRNTELNQKIKNNDLEIEIIANELKNKETEILKLREENLFLKDKELELNTLTENSLNLINANHILKEQLESIKKEIIGKDNLIQSLQINSNQNDEIENLNRKIKELESNINKKDYQSQLSNEESLKLEEIENYIMQISSLKEIIVMKENQIKELTEDREKSQNERRGSELNLSKLKSVENVNPLNLTIEDPSILKEKLEKYKNTLKEMKENEISMKQQIKMLKDDFKTLQSNFKEQQEEFMKLSTFEGKIKNYDDFRLNLSKVLDNYKSKKENKEIDEAIKIIRTQTSLEKQGFFKKLFK